MSQSEQPKKAGATFLWVLGAFAGFAVLFTILQAVSDSKRGFDPRESERLANTAEIVKAQAESIAKLGLNDEAKKKAVFEKTLILSGITDEILANELLGDDDDMALVRIQLDKDSAEKLEQIAKKQKKSLSEVVSGMLEKQIEKEKNLKNYN